MSACKGYVECWWRDFKHGPIETDLELAVERNNLEAVKDFLNDDVSQYTKDKALFRAIENNNIDISHFVIVYELLLAHADPNAQIGPDTVPVLNYAVDHGNIIIVKLLLDFDADPNLESKDHIKAIDRAIASGSRDLFDLLLPISEIRINQNNNPLLVAVSIDDSYIISELLKQGLNPNELGPSGNNALHEATYAGYTPIVELLLKYGADPLLKNTYQVTARDIAIDMGFDDIVELIDDYLLLFLKEPGK